MKHILIFVLFIYCGMLAGCGETIGGVGKDVSRMGKGIKTIFISEPDK